MSNNIFCLHIILYHSYRSDDGMNDIIQFDMFQSLIQRLDYPMCNYKIFERYNAIIDRAEFARLWKLAKQKDETNKN